MSNYTLDLSSGELYHFGTKGMKWGVRRYQNPDGSLTPEGMKRYGINGKGTKSKAEQLEIAKQMNMTGKYANTLTTTGRFFGPDRYHVQEYEGDPNNLKDRRQQEKNMIDKDLKISNRYGDLLVAKKETENADITVFISANPSDKTISKIKKNLHQAEKDAEDIKLNSSKIIDETHKKAYHDSGYTIGYPKLGDNISAIVRENGNNEYTTSIDDDYDGEGLEPVSLIKTDSGWAIKEWNTDKKLQHSVILDLSSGELYHWGIKGQKWGVRRYQNKDGSLTPEGEIHYGRLKNKQRRKELKLQRQANKDEIKKKKALAKVDKNITNAKRRAKLLGKFEDISTKAISNKTNANGNKNKDNSNISKAKGNQEKKAKKNEKKKDFYKQYGNINNILSNGEKRTHDTISNFYKDKYVLNSQSKLKTRKFKKMSTQDLQNYINRYNTETNFMGAYEKRSPYDFSARTLKRWSSNVTSAAKIALGVYCIKKIMEKK